MSHTSSSLIKICGTTSVADALLAGQGGADFIGVVVEHPPSPRSIDLEQAQTIKRAISKPLIAIIVNLELDRSMKIWSELAPGALQLHGDEPPTMVRELASRGIRVWKALSGTRDEVERQAEAMAEAGAEALLVDARSEAGGNIIYGGTGALADWSAARSLVERGYRVILAGGLHAGNVKEAIETVRPWMVDVISGVEASKGIKDAEKLRDFIAAARRE